MLNAIIVEDEYLSIERLKKLLEQTKKINVCATYANPLDALEECETINPQVAFLDIEMPEINGLELAEKLIEKIKDICIVFVTAYNEYAVDAFELSALDYLLKPISKERLNKTVDRIASNVKVNNKDTKVIIKCMGGFEVIVKKDNEENTIKFRTSKAEEILALMISNKDKPISTDYIIELLWGEFEVEKAMVNVHTSIHYLRKAIKALGTEDFIKSSKGHYYIKYDEISCDVYEIEKLIEKAEKGDYTIEELENINRLYNGSLFDGKDYLWAEEYRISLESSFIKILLSLYDYYYDNVKDYYKCVEIMRKAIKINPFSELLSEKLINAYIILNDKPSAVKYYNKYKLTLKNELDIEPGDEIERLIKKL